MNPQSTEQIQAHYYQQQTAAAIVARYFSLPDDSLVVEFCAAQCPPSNHKWNEKNAGAWLQEQSLTTEELAKQYQLYLKENIASFSKVYQNCY